MKDKLLNAIQLKRDELKIIKDEGQKLYKKESSIETEIDDLLKQYILEFGLLTTKQWSFVRYSGSDAVFEADDTCYWDELEDLYSGELSYHYNLPLVDDEISIHGDDGRVYLFINVSKWKKWVDILKVDISKHSIQKYLNEKDKTIKDLQKQIDDMKSVLGD